MLEDGSYSLIRNTLLIVLNGIEIGNVQYAYSPPSLLIVLNGIEIWGISVSDYLSGTFNRTKWNWNA